MLKLREFGLGPVLTIAHGRLLCEMKEVYDILNWMTGDNLYSHQLPRAMNKCRPHLKRQFPHLFTKDVEAAVIEYSGKLKNRTDDVPLPRHWVISKVNEWGMGFSVPQLREGTWKPMHPLLEIGGMQCGYKPRYRKQRTGRRQ